MSYLQLGADFSGSAPVYMWFKNTCINVRGTVAEDTTADLTQEPKEPNFVHLSKEQLYVLMPLQSLKLPPNRKAF